MNLFPRSQFPVLIIQQLLAETRRAPLAFGEAMQRRPNTNRKLAKARGHKAETPKRRERQLETKVAERTAELRRSEAYLAEAQRLSQTGSWAWSPEEGIRYWSEECYRVLSFDPQGGLPQHED